MEAADILEHEQVHVVDVDNGARFETYTIAGERGSGAMKVNGAAARLVHRGDTIIVISYAQYDRSELERYEPRVVHVQAQTNRIITVDDAVATLLTGLEAASVNRVREEAQHVQTGSMSSQRPVRSRPAADDAAAVGREEASR